MAGISETTSADRTVRGIPDGLFVKDYDGTLKVLSHGELQELDEFLKASESTSSAGDSLLPSASSAATQSLPAVSSTRALVPQDSHFQEPAKDTRGSEKSTLHFHPDDKNEIQSELEKLQNLLGDSPDLKRYSILKITRKLAENHAIPVTGDIFKVFTRSILSFFRQLRNTVETKDLLTKPVHEGGVGLTVQVSDSILKIIRNLKDRIEEVDGVIVDDIDGPPPSPVVQPKASPAVPEKFPQPQRMGIASEVASPKPAVPAMQPGNAPNNGNVAPKIPEEKSAGNASQNQIPAHQPQSPMQSVPPPLQENTPSLPKVQRPGIHEDTTIPVIQDVRRPGNSPRGKLVGKVEELAAIDLATFRMLDQNPRIRAGKILGKIQNLQSESFIRKSQGIDAWRGSETYKLYLEVGQRSLDGGKNVAQAIGDAEASGRPSLTLEEFEAISDLNRALRF